jgi:voltage-gated potassium channel Kch
MSETENTSRSYGAGAAGDTSSSNLTRLQISWRQKLRYRFDNSLSKGPGAFASWLAVTSVLLTLLVSLIWQIAEPTADKNFVAAVIGKFFDSINIIFLGNSIPFANGFERTLAIAFWLIRTAIAGSVIGFITNLIADRMERLKKGKSPIIESGHTLILGWSSRVFPILQQLSVANENVSNPLVVIFSDQDREFMDDEIQSRVGEMGSTRVVTRTGDPTNPRDLERANINAARSIIILDANELGDATVVATVLGVRAVTTNSDISIVAEIDELDHADALAHATDGQVKAVQSKDVIARVTAQASRQPGLAAVVLDLLDFEGDEIYFQDASALVGRTYGDALLGFDNSSIIGLQSSDGTVSINPPATSKISVGDKVIAIAQDDDKVVFNGVRDDLKKVTAVSTGKKRSTKPEHILVIGWSEMGHAVISELAQFLPAGSSIKIVANPKLVDTEQLKSLKFGKITAKFVAHRGDINDLANAAKGRKLDEVIVLGYRENISVAEADSHTMMTMLLMNKLFEEDGNGVQPTRLVAEILDSRKAELARVAAVDDLVVSDNLAALMIAQISENPDLAPVFTDLFDADGASINVKPISEYTKAKSAPYAELVAAARSRGESAIGYRKAKFAKGDPTSGVDLNPAKSTWYTIDSDDALVVIGPVR